MNVDMFVDGYSLLRYDNFETRLVEHLRYTPLEYYPSQERKLIRSPILADLLNNIGSQIDSFFRNWKLVQNGNPNINSGDLKFGNYKVIEKTLHLNDKGIEVLQTDEFIKPYNNWTKTDPIWWMAYNENKHDDYHKKECGNLHNVLVSLGALFILNCENKDVWKRLFRYGYIRDSYIDPLERENMLASYPSHIDRNMPYYYAYHPYAMSTVFRYKTSIEITIQEMFNML